MHFLREKNVAVWYKCNVKSAKYKYSTIMSVLKSPTKFWKLKDKSTWRCGGKSVGGIWQQCSLSSNETTCIGTDWYLFLLAAKVLARRCWVKKNQSWALALYFQVRSPLSVHFISMDRYLSSAHLANFKVRSSLNRSKNQWFALGKER